MNKRVFYLVILLLLVVSGFSMKLYFSFKKEALEENSYIVLLENKLKKVSALKNKYQLRNDLLNRLKRYCTINDKSDSYFIKCSNLNSTKFNLIQNILFKNNFKIKQFNIYKTKLANIEVEISK